MEYEEHLVCTHCQIKAIDHSMHVSCFSSTPVAAITVISVVHSGYRYVPLFVYSGLLLTHLTKRSWGPSRLISQQLTL